jgi:hypothetical protein
VGKLYSNYTGMAGLIMAGTTNFYGISYPTSTDYVKDGATAIQTVATGFDSAVAIPTYNAQTGATYTFVLSDTGKTVTASNASAQTYTIPPTASVAWTANTTLRVLNLGAGVVTFAAGAGVTVTNTAQTLAQYQSAQLVRTGLNAWTVTPDSGTASGLTLISATTVGTTVSSVTVTGAFSATYDNYRIVYGNGTSSASNPLEIKLGASVTGYSGILLYAAYASGGALIASINNGSSWPYVGGGDSNGTGLICDLINPGLAKYTFVRNANYANATETGFFAGVHKVSTAYTDFTLLPGSGTLTGGTISVYGYNK